MTSILLAVLLSGCSGQADDLFSGVFVTPESFGAVGDGVADDTLAWQKAVDSGRKVIATKKKYKCGTIYITQDVEIDCGNAQFYCMDSVLFHCAGSVYSESHEDNYNVNCSYRLRDEFTGIVYLLGTNNVFAQRECYLGGSIEEFYNGVLNTQIPIDCHDVTAYRLNTIKANISNISNILFEDVTGSIAILMNYCAHSLISNVTVTNLCYSVIQFQQCYNCGVKDCHFDIPQYLEKSKNYYPVFIIDSSYTIMENVYIHCVGWHCISTGNQTLCRGTKVINCQLFSDYGVPAYHDHENGIETTIVGSTLSSVTLGAFGRLIDSDIICNKDPDYCHVNLHMYSVPGLAVYMLDGCRFYPQSAENAAIRLYCSPRESGYEYDYYLENLMISNCYNCNQFVDLPIKKATSKYITGSLDFGTIEMYNSILNKT